MIVHVQDRDAPAGGDGMLGSDRRIAEVGIAAEIVSSGVMARRTAQREGRALAADHRLRCRHRRLRRPISGVPGSGRDWRGGVEAELAE